jgi:hypothetical protein
MKITAILAKGSVGPRVVELKQRLMAQGFWSEAGTLSRTFGVKLEEAVAYFQQTHLGPDGKPLAVDGLVGPDTMWALKHPTGKAQKEGLGRDADDRYENIPAGIGPDRKLLLVTALNQYGIRERPMGSNRGDAPNGGVDKFLPTWCKKKPGKGPAWCCFFVSWVTKEVFGTYPLGRVHGSCAKAWEAAMHRRMAWPKYKIVDTREPTNPVHPLPGDAFYMRWGPRTGHIGFVYRVSEDGTEINTIEGNCANRVKIGRRSVDDRIFGWIDFWGDSMAAMEYSKFERGLIQAPNVGRARTR